MRAGSLRHRILVEQPITAQNETGEEEITWSSFGTFWGSVEPLRGRELLRSEQILATMDTRIRLRWSERANQIVAKWRMQHLGVIYNIVSSAHIDMARREIEFMAMSGSNQG